MECGWATFEQRYHEVKDLVEHLCWNIVYRTFFIVAYGGASVALYSKMLI